MEKHSSGTKTGWLFNYHPTTIMGDEDEENTGPKSSNVDGLSTGKAALTLLFQDHAGNSFFVNLQYDPYFFVMPVEGHEREVELGLMSMFGPQLIQQITTVEKEDLDLVNHLSGRKRRYLKVVFSNVQNLMTVRGRLDTVVKRNRSISGENLFSQNQFSMLSSSTLADVMQNNFEEEDMANRLDNPGSSILSSAKAGGDSLRWTDWVQDVREYDVKYHMRVAIDQKIFVGLWYTITVNEGITMIERCDDSMYAPAMPHVIAFDIETTKAPLKFPQPEVDQIYMISYMLDGRGYLIINREIVTADILPFEYTPKPEYEGVFNTFNEPDEARTLRRFFDEMKKYNPNVYVTYNGDYFDFPFIHARSLFHGMNMRDEIGFSQAPDGAFLNPEIPHLDCFYWVKRDSYLPQGSQGLKAVTKYKLGYDPIEVDPEEMLPLAQREPQKMASYSVSDAVSTWYLYQKYVHPFIFSLATIIPMSPDDVLRKGSGGLCEALLMVQAEANNVIFPNKKETIREKFHDGHLIDSETYIGGRVEALRSGVYRADIPVLFNMNPETYQNLIDDVDNALKFTLEIENGLKMEEVTNLDEVRTRIVESLTALRDKPHQKEKPLIYHLDVGAMYPNIILTNRLQPYAIPTAEMCAGCCFNSPNNELQCKRAMSWKWRGELFTAGRYEYQRVKAQLENESFAENAIQQVNLAAVQKKAYGQRRGNVLEGTTYEARKFRKGGDNNNNGGGGGSGGPPSGYRQATQKQIRESKENLLQKEFGEVAEDSENSDDENGLRAYGKLNEATQFNMIKKRLSEYSRKAYGKIHESREIIRTNTVCQRENSFYVDTVRLFRDRRYEYKAALKTWKKKLDAATEPDEIKLCKSRCVQMESLQLAHKCILNSFYGYVMRKGSRWSSMEMAGIVTYLGATLIQMARALVQQIGVTLELDTDGIWCCLPCTFPENYTITTSNPKKPKVSISYPCVVLNKMVHDRYTNHQYQEKKSVGVYETRSENSIYFEVDGPYLAMLLPASKEEGKSIKKRYAVFNNDGSLAELKGFELKRRGELMLIKDFQSQVFRRFLDGSSLVDAYASAATVADTAIDLLESKGEGYSTEEILEKITESSNMSRKLSEYPESQKSLAITTARRIAEFLGPQMVKDKGLACHFIISRMPMGRPVTERAIPVVIFRAEPKIRAHFIRKWTSDNSISIDTQLQQILDWDYYAQRFSSCVQKIITIPAALQSLPNPVPRVAHPEWLDRKIKQQDSRFRQTSLTGMFEKRAAIAKRQEEEDGVVFVEHSKAGGDSAVPELQDLEDFFAQKDSKKQKPSGKNLRKEGDSDWEEDEIVSVASDTEEEKMRQEKEAIEAERLTLFQRKYFSPNTRQKLDAEFFNDELTQKFLLKQQLQWKHRTKLRKELALSSTIGGNKQDYRENQGSIDLNETGMSINGNTLTSHFVDMKSQALNHPWSVLEVRGSSDNSDLVQVVALVNKRIHVFRVQVPLNVVLNTDPDCKLNLRGAKSTEFSKCVLPRRKTPGRVYQVEIPSGVQGERLLNELSVNEGVRDIYEQHFNRVDRFIEISGCCLMVKPEIHLKNSRNRPAHLRDVFHIEELEMNSSSSHYLTQVGNRTAFIYHSTMDTRGVIAFVNKESNTALVVYIQPAGAARPTINFASLVEETSKQMQAPTDPIEVTMEVVNDIAPAWRLIHNHLSVLTENGRAPYLVVVQSVLTTAALLQQRALPSQLAYVRVLGAHEDEKLFADRFRWTRRVTQRLLQRYFACGLWVDERLKWSRLTNIPLCNVAQDSCVHSLDVLYIRALHRRSHVLWNSMNTEIAYDSIEERPREVVKAGGYCSYAVEFSLSRLDVVAILFSQMIQEGDDPNSQILCDRGISSQFNVLRDLVADLLSQAVHSTSADTLLSNITRWIHDPVSKCYEPRIIEKLNSLTHRALTALLIRLSKLGGRPVKIEASSMVVLTSKYSISDAVSFANFVTSSLQDHPMMILLSITPTRYWCPFVLLDKRDLIGFYIPAEKALQYGETEKPPLHECTVYQTLTLDAQLPLLARTMLRDRCNNTLQLIYCLVGDVHQAVENDPSVTLANKTEEIKNRIFKKIQHLFESTIQPELMEEVQRLLDTRELYSEEEVKSSPTSLTNTTVAVEYAKYICAFLDVIPSGGVISKLKNNCMRLCGLSPFAPVVQYNPNSSETNARLQIFTCAFCNQNVTLDMSVPRSEGQPFSCPDCRSPILPAAMEAHLVRAVNLLVLRNNDQDFICSKCGEAVSTFMGESCCGAIVPKGKPIRGELNALLTVATLQHFEKLQECVNMALLCC